MLMTEVAVPRVSGVLVLRIHALQAGGGHMPGLLSIRVLAREVE